MPSENNLKQYAQANDESNALRTSTSGYNVDSLMYPEDLGGENSPYGGNRVVFFINVAGASSIAVNDKRGEETMDIPKSRFLSVSGETMDKAKESIRGNIKSITDKELRMLSPKKRLKTAISLYVPEALAKSYSVSWDEASSEEMATGEILAQSATAVSSLLPGSSTTFSEEAKSVLSKVGSNTMSHILNGIKYAQKATGVAPGNSKAQLLFNKVDFNTFTFDYRFSPKSSEEAKKVLNIIRTFRHHMLPEFFDAEQYLYIYPSEFEVRYYRGTSENEFLEQHITSVLTNMTINYNPNGQYTTFADGMPTHINMSLTFKELGVPTKETSPYDKSGA